MIIINAGVSKYERIFEASAFVFIIKLIYAYDIKK